jgi:acetylornithine/LysW-gamma-L-lysine aminotransferase
VGFDDLAALDRAVDDTTAAVLLEPIPATLGMPIPSPEYLPGVQALCRARGAKLILDEVQTGLGRTGRMFACEHSQTEPDMMCLAKGLAGGVPMGALLCSGRVTVPTGGHGTTYGGNPLACAASLATIRFILSNRLPEEAARKGELLRSRLRALELDVVREVRGLGLMVGVGLKTRVKPYLEALASEGVLALAAGASVLRLLPPLTITEDELERVSETIGRVLAQDPIEVVDAPAVATADATD